MCPTIWRMGLPAQVGSAPTVTFSASASGVGAAASTVVVPADIYEHGFEDSTDGNFTRNGSAGLLVADGGVWTIANDAPTGAGTKSITTTIPVSAGNYGSALVNYDLLSESVRAVYTRFAIKWESNFNFNTDHKVNRLQVESNGNHGSFLTENGGAFWWFWDDFGGSRTYANTNTPAPNANDLRGSWQWFEIRRDYTDASNLRAQVWINDVLYFDYTFTPTASTGEADDIFRNLQWFGTFNSVATEADIWLDHIGIGTSKMGVP